VETARKIARHYQAGFVVLDAERRIARVVFPEGTADFAQIEGENLEADLRRRDYTVNAIAYNPHTAQFLDPLGGLEDLQRGVLRMVSPANLEDDPLRLLRAYRQASQSNFTIDPTTRSTIRTLAPLLGKVAAERVQTELGYLLGSSPGSQWLAAAWEDGLLPFWFESATAEDLRQVGKVDQAAQILGETWLKLGKELKTPVGSQSTLAWQSLAKLATLVSSVPEEAESQLEQLKYSRAEIGAVTTTVRHLPQLWEAASMTLREQYFFFVDVGEVFPCLVVLALAVGVEMETVAPLIERYLNPNDPVAYPTPLVTGKDLMRSLSLSPSPRIGKLLTEIQIAHIEGKISTPEDALKFAAKLIDYF
jgi:tRNA nucleotidyltransferase (CCA-adding enzyme)